MNSVQLIGRLAADPEIRYQESGKVIANIRIAVRRNKDTTDWVNVTAFDKVAEMLVNYVTKGREVGITGRLQVDTWTDKESGANRSAMKVIASQITLIGNKNDKPAEGDAGDVEPF